LHAITAKDFKKEVIRKMKEISTQNAPKPAGHGPVTEDQFPQLFAT